MEELLAEKSAIESSRGGCIRQAGSPEVGFADVHGSSRNYASLDSGSFLCIQVVSPSKKKKNASDISAREPSLYLYQSIPTQEMFQLK